MEVNTLENREQTPLVSSWDIPGFNQEALNIHSSPEPIAGEDERCNLLKNVLQEKEEGATGVWVKNPLISNPSLSSRIIYQRRSRRRSSLMQNWQRSDELSSLNFNSSAKKYHSLSPKRTENRWSSRQNELLYNYDIMSFLFSSRATTGGSIENSHFDPMKFAPRDLEYIRHLKLTPDSLSITQPPDSDILNSFEGEDFPIGENSSHKERREKRRAFIAKKLENYVYVGILGQGGFSEVELVFDKQTKKLYAMKRYPKPGKPFDSEMAENEYLILTKIRELDDSDLLQVKDIFYNPGESLIVIMEYARGGTLETLLHYIDQQKQKGKLPPQNLWKTRDLQILYQQLMNQIRKLARLGILHCDIKCDNIIIREDGTLILSDYGCAQICTPEYTEKELDRELKFGCANPDVYSILRTIRYILCVDKNGSDLYEIIRPSLLSKPSHLKETVSFYSNIKDRYTINLFKYPFKTLDSAYENILKFIVYFNTGDILKYIRAEFDNIESHNHRELQAFYYFIGEIFQRSGHLRLGYLCLKKSEQELKATGHEIDHFRAGHLYRKLGIIQMKFHHASLAYKFMQMALHYYWIAEQNTLTELQKALNEEGELSRILAKERKAVIKQNVLVKQKAFVQKIKEIGRTYHWLACLKGDHGDLLESEDFYKEGILCFEIATLFERQFLKKEDFEDLYLISLYHDVGATCKFRGQFEVALSLTGATVFKYCKELGLIHPSTASSVYYLGMIFQQMKNFEAALKCYRLSIGIFNRSFLQKDHNYLNALIQRASIYYTRGEKRKALMYYGESLVICRKTDLRLPYEYYLKYIIAVVLIDLKIFYQTALKYLNWFLEGYSQEKPENKYIIAKVWVNLGFARKLDHNFTLNSKIYHRRMKLIAENPDECPCFALAILEIAINHIVHKVEPRYKEASELLEKVYIQMKKRIFAFFPSHFETCLYYLGHIYCQQQMHQKSHFYFQECLEIRRFHCCEKSVVVINEEDSLQFLCQLEV